MLAVSFLGFLDASYLTASHFLHFALPCSIINGCETVTSSIYATVGPVPISLVGAAYYLAILILLLIFLDSKSERFLKYAAYLSPIGFLVSMYLVSLQIFVIHALCLYCMASAGSSTLLFLLGLGVLLRKVEVSGYISPGPEE